MKSNKPIFSSINEKLKAGMKLNSWSCGSLYEIHRHKFVNHQIYHLVTHKQYKSMNLFEKNDIINQTTTTVVYRRNFKIL